MAQVDTYLRSDEAEKIFDDFTNARFYVAVGYVMKTLNAYAPDKIRWDKNHHRMPKSRNTARLASVLVSLKAVYDTYQAENPESTKDQVFKGRALKSAFFTALSGK